MYNYIILYAKNAIKYRIYLYFPEKKSYLHEFSFTFQSENMSTRFWSPKKRAIVVTLRGEGCTYQQNADRIGANATKSSVYKLCKKFEMLGQVTDKKRIGRKKITSSQTDRFITRAVMKDLHKPSKDIAADLNEPEVSVSSGRVRRRLWQAGLKDKTPRKKTFLNLAQTQRRKRVAWQ